MNRYLALFWRPYEQGRDHTLETIHPDTGLIENSTPISNIIYAAFALNGEVLIGIHINSGKYQVRLHHIQSGTTEELP